MVADRFERALRLRPLIRPPECAMGSTGNPMAIFDNQPEDPAIHTEAVRLARRLVGIIEPCLPGPEATQQALTEFYSAIRFTLREFKQTIRENGKAR